VREKIRLSGEYAPDGLSFYRDTAAFAFKLESWNFQFVLLALSA
jgi:hypothetical protein